MVTPVGGIEVEGDTVGLTLLDSTVDCPQCGGTAQFIDGTFNIRNGIIEVIRGTSWTKKKVREYQKGLHDAAAVARENPAEALARLHSLDPAIANLVSSTMLKQPQWSVYNVIMLIATILGVATGGVGTGIAYQQMKNPPAVITTDQIEDSVQKAFEEFLEQSRKPSAGSNPPAAPTGTESTPPNSTTPPPLPPQ